MKGTLIHKDGIMGLLCFSIRFFRQIAASSGDVLADVPDGSRTEFEVGRATSNVEVLGTTTGAPVEIQTNL